MSYKQIFHCVQGIRKKKKKKGWKNKGNKRNEDVEGDQHL